MNISFKIKFIIKTIIAVAILVYLAFYTDVHKIYDVLINGNLSIIGTVAVLGCVNLYFQFLKWKIICNENLNVYDFQKILFSLFAGFSAGLITPMRLGEYLGRYMYFNKQGLFRVTYAVIADKLSLLLIEIIAGGFLSLLFIYRLMLVNNLLFLVLTIVYLFLTLLLTAFIAELIPEKYFLLPKIKNSRRIKNFYEKYEAFKITGTKLKLKIICVSFLQFLCYMFQFLLLVKAFKGDIDYWLIFLAAGFIYFAKNFAAFLTPGELGTREGVSVFVLSLVAVNSAVGFNSAIMLFFINILLPAVAGIFFLNVKNNE